MAGCSSNRSSPEELGGKLLTIKVNPLVLKAIQKMLAGKPKIDYSVAARNDPCPCGSGKKFKSCHYDKVRGREREVQMSKLFRNPK